jgi:hypothetical protein
VAEHAGDRIPVAALRAGRRPAGSPPERVDASGAGLVLLVLIVLFSAAGAWIGGQFGAPSAGAIMGGVLGLPASFAGVYTRYRRL